jgi:hypothetical protein
MQLFRHTKTIVISTDEEFEAEEQEILSSNGIQARINIFISIFRLLARLHPLEILVEVVLKRGPSEM